MPAKASTRLPESDATDASSGLRRARSTGLRRAAISAATAPAAAPLPTTKRASVSAHLRPPRRAQGAGRNHPAVAEAAAAIDHDQRHVLGHRRILETVVHQDDGST